MFGDYCLTILFFYFPPENHRAYSNIAGAGTVLKLGTQKHHDLLVPQIDSLAATGCFALTELGFGEHPSCFRASSMSAS